jgi:hypothetical protein
MEGAKGDGFKDKKVKSAGKQFSLVGHEAS